MPGVGIDGCRAGWLAIALGPGEAWRYRVERFLGPLIEQGDGTSRVLLDMPLGLLSGPVSERECDRLARAALGRPRAASVFTPPARPTLEARDYREALEINRACVGKGLSKQAWNLAAKIREADRLRREVPELEGRLHEAHPELCFWALNQRQAPLHNKKTPQGRRERLAILSRFRRDAEAIAETVARETRRREVARDDILDAMVLAIAASLGKLASLPIQPERDEFGIAMEIAYPDPDGLAPWPSRPG
jgi:predicted RNase H-like nuclease